MIDLFSCEVEDSELSHIYYELRSNGAYASHDIKFGIREMVKEMQYSTAHLMRGHMHTQQSPANWMVTSESFAAAFDVNYNENASWESTREK
jgi:hypothetical protein